MAAISVRIKYLEIFMMESFSFYFCKDSASREKYKIKNKDFDFYFQDAVNLN
jgi:hypothetical protein